MEREKEREMMVRKSKRMWTYVLIQARKIDSDRVRDVLREIKIECEIIYRERENPQQSGGLCFQVIKTQIN